MKHRYTLILAACICTLLAVLWQEANLIFLENSSKVVHGMIKTTDDASYLLPPIHWLETGEWTDGSIGKSGYFQRPPGYGFLFLLSTLISSSKAYLILKLIQIVGFFASILLVGKIVDRIGLNRNWTLIGAISYGLLPCFSGFLYHSLTEGITPFLLLWSTYEWIKVVRNEGNYLRYTISNAFMLLVRPQLALFALVFIVYFLWCRQKKAFWWSTLILLPFFCWQMRTMILNEGIAGIHPIYSVTNQSLYRPPHQAITELFKVWEYRSDRFHETIGMLTADSSQTARNSALLNIPEKYRGSAAPILAEFQALITLQRRRMADGELTRLLPEEKAFIAHAYDLTSSLSKSNKLDTYILTPVRSTKELLINSHLHLSIFQVKYRGTLWMESLRWICLLVILMSICATFLVLLLRRKTPTELWILSIPILGTICYLVCVQRLNEERYLTPILPIAFISMVWLMSYTIRRIRN